MRNVLSVIAPANRDHSIYYYEDVIDNGFLMQLTINIGNHASWPPDTAYHHFLHEPFLTADEITKINDWVDRGMPSGNPNNAPPGPVYANESFIGDPDTILTMQQHFTVPGDDSDHCKIFVIPSG
ncbi:MAG: hypothetical protein LH473_11850, partial [Chitinophagales bacterium]|nr:hypothetical protein [Chitinophagales bacterium]